MSLREDRIRKIVSDLDGLSDGQLMWIERTVGVFSTPSNYSFPKTDFFPKEVLQDFGDTLRIHHAFSAEAFSKDKFEYAVEQLFQARGLPASLAQKGNRGHDITIGKSKVSLKTQADKNIKLGEIWISKFMELGGGQWGSDPNDLVGLREQFLKHLDGYDRIFTLRTLKRSPDWSYELVEIPKDIFLKAEQGDLEMMMNSRQNPKPGYCHVPDKQDPIYSLYFDGGGERKLQVKGLKKEVCEVHASWSFAVPNPA